MLIPFLDQVLGSSSALGVNTAVLAMSHRSRLNVMANTIGPSPVEIFARFEDVNPQRAGRRRCETPPWAPRASTAPRTAASSGCTWSRTERSEAVDPVALGRSRQADAHR